MKSKVIKRCGNCGRFLSEEDFGWKNKTKAKRKSYCNKCALVKNYLDYHCGSRGEYARKYAEQYRKDNPETVSLVQKKWRADNPNYNKQWCIDNTERVKAYNAKYKKQNRDKVNVRNNKRRASKLNATPPWANEEIINAIYRDCYELNKLYPKINNKPKFHVDHYYPLQSDFVCGLHHENNLHIMEAKDNMSKNNEFPESDIQLDRVI